MAAPVPQIRIAIELDPGAEPLSGTIRVAGEEPRPFVGWMQLAHAIDVARAAGAAGDAGQ